MSTKNRIWFNSCPYPYQRTIKISSLNRTLTYSKPRLFELFPIFPRIEDPGQRLVLIEIGSYVFGEIEDSFDIKRSQNVDETQGIY